MPVITGEKILKAKSPSGGGYTFDIEFNDADFTLGTGYSVLEGPLSLAVEIYNNLNNPVYFGLLLEYNDKVVIVADRINIGFCASKSRAVVSGASVPQLCHITGIITKVTVRFYTFDTGITTDLRVSLRINAPIPISAPQLPIGYDRRVETAAVFQKSEGTWSIGSGSSNSLLQSLTNTQYRLKLTNAFIRLDPTPYPGDLRARIQISVVATAIHVLAEVSSKSGEYSTLVFDRPGIILEPNDIIEIRADNNNASNSYGVKSLLTAEKML